MEEEGSGETKSSLVLCICPKPESGVIPAILMRGGGAVLRKTYLRSKIPWAYLAGCGKKAKRN